MPSKIKSTIYKVVLAANILAIIMLLLVGNVDSLHPVDHPWLANFGLGFPIVLAINLIFLVLWIVIRPKNIWLPVLGLLICYVPIRKYTPFNIKKEPPVRSLKVLSYNVFMFAVWDFESEAHNPIVDYIVKSKADIVCLQETDAYGKQRDYIYKTLEKTYPYHDFVSMTEQGYQHMMLLSRYPIIKKERIKYKSEGNISYAYIINYNNQEVLVVNNHFESNHLSEADKQGYKNIVRSPFGGNNTKKESERILDKLGEAAIIRAPQVEAVAAYVKKYLDKKIPVILCGDFNDNPISYAHKTIANCLDDAYIKSGNGPGISYNRRGMYVRIDNIFCSNDFEAYGAKVDDKISSSDHYPIYAWLKYRPKY